MDFHAFFVGEAILLSIHRARGCQYHAAHLRVADGFHQSDSAADVYEVVIAREKLGFRDGHLCREMINAVDVLQKSPEQGFIIDVTLGEINFGEQTGGIASRSVIQHAHEMPLPGKTIAERRSEKASPSGN